MSLTSKILNSYRFLLIFISLMIRTDIGMVYISTREGVDPQKYFEFVESIKVQGTQGYFGVMAGRPIIQFEVCQKAE